MSYTIPDSCISCGVCRPQCPTGAIAKENNQYRIDPFLCNNCEGFYSEPQCIVGCPISCPVPAKAKKGRYKANDSPASSFDLFPDSKNHPLATSIVIWEACNLLAQRASLPWQTDITGKWSYRRSVSKGKGAIALWIASGTSGDPALPLPTSAAKAAIAAIDIRAACLHLIYAACATTLDKPWEQEFTISDREIAQYLGLDKRKDLSKAAKLTLIKELAQQPCAIATSIIWPQQGKIKGFTLENSRLWHLQNIQHYFQTDDSGCKHLTGLAFTIRPGMWAQYFLDRQGCQQRSAFYQYGTLPKSLLHTITSIWQQHEGAARMMLWLLFKTKVGQEQRLAVPTLMRVAYGEKKLAQASSQREERKRLLRTFESDLEVLSNYGLQSIFDPLTYQKEIQPLWAKLSDLPDDAEAALEFWINDASSDKPLTDSSPRGKWNLLMNARILSFKLPPEWHQQSRSSSKKKPYPPARSKNAKSQSFLSSEEIKAMRTSLHISQRELAQMIGKSQSWIRDLENGRFSAKSADQNLLRQALGLR